MVVAELMASGIDVIPWSDDPVTFVGNALSPAKVSNVLINPADHTATVIVPDDQLSLAIGKEGQNARLAAKLTGWRIDIKSLTQAVSSGLTTAATSSEQKVELGDGRCIHVTEDGIRCRNQCVPGSLYCRIHEEEARA